MCGGLTLLLGFVLWTILIQMVDVKPEGIDGTDIGFRQSMSGFIT